MARHDRNIREFTTPISWDPVDDIDEYHTCLKCRMKRVIFGNISHDCLQSFLKLEPNGTERKWLPISKPNRKIYYFTAHLNQDGSSTWFLKYLILGIDYKVTFWPRELGVNPIYEFDSSAARWLNLTEL